MARKHPHNEQVNKIIGNKIYSLRLGLGLSRESLAETVGVTHQQIQKYEKGKDNITVGRLSLIAKALGETIDYFYKDMDVNKTEAQRTQHQRLCIEVSRNFMKIKNACHQEAVNTLVRSLLQEAA